MKRLFLEIQKLHPEHQPSYNLIEWGHTSREFLELISEEFSCSYPNEFIEFQLEYCTFTPMDDFAWDGFGWANPLFEPYMNLYEIVKDARLCEVPFYLAPFKVDNGDYYCFDTRNGKNSVVIWDHNSNMIESDKAYQWDNFIEWLHATFRE